MEEIIPLNSNEQKPIINPIELEFKNLLYSVENSEKQETPILSNLSGCFKPGKLYGLLGPSGAGKTSLLNILSGFKKRKFTGTIKINGQQMNRNEFRLNSSYITQEFAMLPKLTVRETIRSSADFKLSSKYTNQMKNNIVSEIIRLLNLTKSTNTLVEKLSGGEKKRLSIAVELVTHPPIMFFDEPTSGLDSVAAFQIMSYLKTLTQSNHTIICIVHQPSSKIIELFDNLYVLSNGKCIYNGALTDMITTFGNAGFSCPNYYNRADFAIEVANLDRGEDLQKLLYYNNYPAVFTDHQLTTIKITADVECNNTNNNTCNARNFIKKLAKSNCRYSTSFCSQLYYLVKRHMISSSRDFTYTQFRVICHILIGFLFGTVFYDIGDNASVVYMNLFCIICILLILFFGNSLTTILSVPTEIEVFIREHSNNWYSISAYYVSKLISDLPLQILMPFMFMKIIFYMTGQPTEQFRFWYCYLICFLITILAYLFGLTLGAMVSVKVGIFAIPAVNIPILVFAGIFIKFNDLSVYLQPFMYLSYFRNAYVGSILALYGYDRPKLKCSEMYCHVRRPLQILEFVDALDDNYWNHVGAIALWILALLIVFFIALITRVKSH